MDRYATYIHKYAMGALAALLFALGVVSSGRSAEDRAEYGLGRLATEEEIRAWNIDVAPSGEGLPPGQGTVRQGTQVFATKCAACHGPTGTEGPKDRLVGGQNTLATPKPIKTIGSYWPYATTLYDYIHRAMPFNAPQSLAPDEVYALCAYLLHLNGIVPQDAVMDAQSLPQVVMPNHAGFTSPDPRPDVFDTVDEELTGSVTT